MAKIDQSNDFKNSIIYMLPLGISMLLPLITLPIFTRILTPEDYGLLALSLVFAVFANSIVNFGTSVTYERNYFEYLGDKKKFSQLFYSCFLFINVNFVLSAIVIFYYKAEISYLLTRSYDHGFFVFLTFIGQYFFHTISKNYYTYLRNSYRSTLYSKYTIINSIIYFFLCILFIVYFRVGVIGFVYSQLITGLILFLMLSRLIHSELRFSLSKTLLLETLKISYPLTPTILIGVFSKQFNTYMIGLLATIGSAGIYDLAQKFVNLIFSLMTALENVFNPKVYDYLFHGKQNRGKEIGLYLTPFIYFSVFIALLVSSLSEVFIVFLIPVEFHPAVNVIYVLSIYFISLFFSKITSMQLFYTKKTYLISALSILGLIINILLNIPLISKFGIMGAAFGTLFSGIIIVSVGLFFSQRAFPIVWEWRKIILIMGQFLVCNMLLLALKAYGIDHIFVNLIKIFFLSSLVFTGVFLGVLTKKNIVEALNFISTFKVSSIKRN